MAKKTQSASSASDSPREAAGRSSRAKNATGSKESNGKPTRRATTTRKKKDRVAVVAGLRTPFARQLTDLGRLNAIDLGRMVVNELIQRAELDPSEIEQLIFGSVLVLPEGPNVAREIVLGLGLPDSIDAYSVSRACATSYQSVANAFDAIELGRIECGLAGGSDSASVVPIQASRALADTLTRLSKARSWQERLRLLAGLRPHDLLPVPPAVKEYSTQVTMGESAEQMARDHGISREEQDDLAHRSHLLAARAWEEGKLDGEVMAAYVPPFEKAFTRDNNVRSNSDRDAYRKLKPVFDRRYGTVTAANSTPLTDGAAAVLLMRESKAKALGYQPLGYVRAHAFAAIDATRDMLMGPSYATPKVLDAMKMTLSDLDLIDMHEAFAAQTLCNLKAFASKDFAREKLGRSRPIGEVDMDKFNVLGGSLAYGHPFAATGARQLTQTLRELHRRGGGMGLVTACAAGGLGAAMIVEAE